MPSIGDGEKRGSEFLMNVEHHLQSNIVKQRRAATDAFACLHRVHPLN